MLSPQLRRKVLNLWTMFWSSGITNPLTAIEQITYLLFLKHLEVLDEDRVKQRQEVHLCCRVDGRKTYQTRPGCDSGQL